MDNQRETKEFTTTKGNKLQIYTYVTGREDIELQSVYMQGAKFAYVNGQAQVENFDPTVEFKAQEALIKILVKSFNDSEDDLVDKVLNLPKSEFEEILAEIDLVAKKK